MKDYAVAFEWRFNDSENRVWRNGWVVAARDEAKALEIGRKKLHKLATSAIFRSKLRLAYAVTKEQVELYPKAS